MLNFIYETMDYYDGTFVMTAKQRQNQILLDATKYQQSTWVPRAGTGGIDIYCDNVHKCRLHGF